MLEIGKKKEQSMRIVVTLTNDLVSTAIERAANRQEADAALMAAREIVATFPRPVSEMVDENS